MESSSDNPFLKCLTLSSSYPFYLCILFYILHSYWCSTLHTCAAKLDGEVNLLHILVTGSASQWDGAICFQNLFIWMIETRFTNFTAIFISWQWLVIQFFFNPHQRIYSLTLERGRERQKINCSPSIGALTGNRTCNLFGIREDAPTEPHWPGQSSNFIENNW